MSHPKMKTFFMALLILGLSALVFTQTVNINTLPPAIPVLPPILPQNQITNGPIQNIQKPLPTNPIPTQVLIPPQFPSVPTVTIVDSSGIDDHPFVTPELSPDYSWLFKCEIKQPFLFPTPTPEPTPDWGSLLLYKPTPVPTPNWEALLFCIPTPTPIPPYNFQFITIQ